MMRFRLLLVAALVLPHYLLAQETLEEGGRCAPPLNPDGSGNVAALSTCITNANVMGGGSIDLGGAEYTLLVGTDFNGEGPNGLPAITSTILIKNGTITRDPESDPFRLIQVAGNGSLSLLGVTLSNGYDVSGKGGGAILVDSTAVLASVNDSVFDQNRADFTADSACLNPYYTCFIAGGAIYVAGSFNTITDTAFSSNQVTSQVSNVFTLGGAIYLAWGAAGNIIADSTFTSNAATAVDYWAYGGAIAMWQSALHKITSTSFTSNSSGYDAGAIGVYEGPGLNEIDSSTFSSNIAVYAGAMDIEGPVGTIANSTFENNLSFLDGGALIVWAGGPYNASIDTMYNNTFSMNLAGGSGGAIYMYPGAYVGQLFNSTIASNSATGTGSMGAGILVCGTIGNMESTIVAENYLTNNAPLGELRMSFESDVDTTSCSGTITLASFNLIGSNFNNNFVEDQNDNEVGTPDDPLDPHLGVLMDNGGPTKTMALLSSSPAIGAGSNPLGLLFDQRGFRYERTVNGLTDIGAYETQAPKPPCPEHPGHPCCPHRPCRSVR